MFFILLKDECHCINYTRPGKRVPGLNPPSFEHQTPLQLAVRTELSKNAGRMSMYIWENNYFGYATKGKNSKKDQPYVRKTNPKTG